MEYQIADEISSFWNDLIIPIVMGTITILFILWIIGKSNRQKLIERLLIENNEYVLEHGIYIKKNQTKSALLKEKIKHKTNLSEIKPILLLFITILLMYGLYRIVMGIFQPNLAIISPNRIFACGIDDYTIANLWIKLPEAHSFVELWRLIESKSNYKRDMELLFSFEAYLRFALVIILVLVVYSRKKDLKCTKRVILSIAIIFILLASTYLSQIQVYNDNTRYMCYDVNYTLGDISTDNDTDNLLDTYFEKIKQEKKHCENDFYFGAFELRYGYVENIKAFIAEIMRFTETQHNLSKELITQS